MSNSANPIDQILTSQAQKEVTANALFDAFSPGSIWGRHASACGGLTWGIYGGNFVVAGVITQIANQTITLTDAATNYLYVTSAGVLTKATSAPAGWPSSLGSGAQAIYQVVTSGGLATSWTDWRVGFGTLGTPGATGPAGPTGFAGPLAIAYTFSTTTTDSDPGTGTLRLSNATQNLSTVIRADLSDSNSIDYTAVLDSLDAATNGVKGSITLSKVGDRTKWLTFNLTARATPSGYRNLTVVPVGNSSASPFANGDALYFQFARAGDSWSISVNAQTGTTYTLASTDNGNVVTLSNASAITLTVPSGLGAGFGCEIIQLGAGVVTVSAGGGVTVNSYSSLFKTAGQHAAATLIAYAADTFNLSGNLSV
jgi:hypothetical protein